MPHIGTLKEKSLHAALKARYAEEGDRLEVPVGPYVVDIVRGDLLIEIQTGGFSPLKRKLADLLAQGKRVHLIHPIAARKWIVRETAKGRVLGRRRSPKRGRPEEIFVQLVRIPGILPQPGFSVEVVLTHNEEVRRNDGRGSWRRKGWSLHDQRLLDTAGSIAFTCREDYLRFIPPGLARPFTNRELSSAASIPTRLAQKMTYTLHKAGWLEVAGKKGNAFLYQERKA